MHSPITQTGAGVHGSPSSRHWSLEAQATHSPAGVHAPGHLGVDEQTSAASSHVTVVHGSVSAHGGPTSAHWPLAQLATPLQKSPSSGQSASFVHAPPASRPPLPPSASAGGSGGS
jgi:hypothetical protein